MIKKNKTQVLLAFWEKLGRVRQLTFYAQTRSKNGGGWDGKGQGDVISTRTGSHVIVFNEKGTWQGRDGVDVNFSNVFRWTLDCDADRISLEHLRYGSEHPVFLFHLIPSDKHTLSSVEPHLCGGDTYFGQIHFDRYSLRLNWRVIGPKKNEELDYLYILG